MENFSISGNIVDVVARRTYQGVLQIEQGKIVGIEEKQTAESRYILPGFIDAHLHVESSLLVPAEFARMAVVHGTIGAVCDPHEIANVLGVSGVEYMIENGSQVPFRFYFGAPSCVPATPHETSGAVITPGGIAGLLARDDIHFLGEMMNYPGVIHEDEDVMEKLRLAREAGRVIDGHAPGLRGPELQKYINAGISTDHECSSLSEALEKIARGMKILIRQGSAARDFNTLIPLMETHPHALMLCTDDLHPDHLLRGHMNLLVRKAISRGCNLYDVLRAVSLNPKKHYGLHNGLLQPGDPADMIVTDNLTDFNVQETYIQGQLLAQAGETLLKPVLGPTPNRFHCPPLAPAELRVPALGNTIRVIQAFDGELSTKSLSIMPKIIDDMVVADPKNDILKLVVVNRYEEAVPAIGFVKGFGLRKGAIASTIAHDSHNIVAVGASDTDLAQAINLLIAHQGGLAVAEANHNMLLPLPVAGLMTTASAHHTAQRYQQLQHAAQQLGSKLTAPFMTLSFMALLVIPELKISDKGLFQVNTFRHVPLFEESE